MLYDESRRKSISTAVKKLVAGDPVLRKCVEIGVISPSKTAELLKPAVEAYLETNVSLPAIKIAVTRLMEELKSARDNDRSANVTRILSRSSVELKTDISILIVGITAMDKIYPAIIEVYKYARFLAVMHSATAVTIVTDSNSIELFRKYVHGEETMLEQRDLAAVVIVSPEDIMYTPGVVSYITGILSSEGINIVHVESSYRDTIIVLSKQDASRAFNLLINLLEAIRVLNNKMFRSK